MVAELLVRSDQCLIQYQLVFKKLSLKVVEWPHYILKANGLYFQLLILYIKQTRHLTQKNIFRKNIYKLRIVLIYFSTLVFNDIVHLRPQKLDIWRLHLFEYFVLGIDNQPAIPIIGHPAPNY